MTSYNQVRNSRVQKKHSQDSGIWQNITISNTINNNKMKISKELEQKIIFLKTWTSFSSSPMEIDMAIVAAKH